MPIQPATLAFAADGTPYSAAYDDLYHTVAGGLEQARQVFLAGNDLPARWHGQERFVILETGFGLGLNFLATWQAWRAAPGRPRRLHFLSVEKHPFTAADLAVLHASYPEVADLSARLRAAWPALTPGFHRLEFDDPGCGTVILTLAFGEAIAAVPQFVGEAQAIYLDGFSPAKNPELWSPQLLREIGLMAAADATAATWSVAGSVRKALADAGFAVEKRAGFGYKRQTLSAHRSGVAETGETGEMDEAAIERRAIVIGAGLAGCLTGERLAARGWAVDLIERRDGVAQETSGNLTAAMLPVLSLDDNRMSRLNRACYLYGLRQVAEWSRMVAGDAAIDWSPCGVLQIARDAAHADKQREILARNGFPPDFVRCVDADEGATLAGLPVAGPGWWFAGGAWVNPASLCRAALARAGERLRTQFGCSVDRIDYDGRQWTISDAAGTIVARAPQLILAGATDIIRLAQAAHLPLFRFRGQVSHLPAPADAPLKSVVCREGYATPAYRNQHCVGASFQRGGEFGSDSAMRESDHAANLERLQRMLPGYCAEATPETVSGRVGFRPVSPDKLPIVGQLYHPDARPQGRDFSAVERWPGLHVASGYGARGLVWSMLMAELLASQLEGDPLPLESDLAATVDPARFLLRRKID